MLTDRDRCKFEQEAVLKAQCEVPCSVGNVVNSSLFINSSLSSTSHAACCRQGGGSASGRGGLPLAGGGPASGRGEGGLVGEGNGNQAYERKRAS